MPPVAVSVPTLLPASVPPALSAIVGDEPDGASRVAAAQDAGAGDGHLGGRWAPGPIRSALLTSSVPSMI